MRVSRVGSLVRSLAALLLASSATLHAATLELPKDAPFVRLEIPDSWPVTQEVPEGVFVTTADAFVFVVLVAPTIKSRDDVTVALNQMVQGLVEKPDLKDVASGEQEDWESDNGIWARGVRTDAQRTDGSAMVFVNQFLEIKPGQYLLVATAGPAEADTAEEDNYEKVLASIEAIAK